MEARAGAYARGAKESLRRDLGEDELVSDLLLSLDQGAAALLVGNDSEPEENRSMEELPQLLDEIVAEGLRRCECTWRARMRRTLESTVAGRRSRISAKGSCIHSWPFC